MRLMSNQDTEAALTLQFAGLHILVHRMTKGDMNIAIGIRGIQKLHLEGLTEEETHMG
jgi:hypothetical protein